MMCLKCIQGYVMTRGNQETDENIGSVVSAAEQKK